MSEIDLTDLNNPHISEVNGVLMDRRFLGNKVKGTLAHWMKENLHVARYCPECYTISRSPGDYKLHFTRRVHLQAIKQKKNLRYF